MTTPIFPWYSSHGWLPVIGAWGGAVGTGIASIFGFVTPDAITAWIVALGSAIFGAANIAILIYQRVEAAKRDEYLRWADAKLKASAKQRTKHRRNSADRPDKTNRHKSAPGPHNVDVDGGADRSDSSLDLDIHGLGEESS